MIRLANIIRWTAAGIIPTLTLAVGIAAAL